MKSIVFKVINEKKVALWLNKNKDTIHPWLGPDEEISYTLSRMTRNYFKIRTDKRMIFGSIKNNLINYLYDSASLIDDWEENNKQTFSKFGSEDHVIYLHLGISYIEGDSPYRDACLNRSVHALENFIRLSPALKGRSALNALRNCVALFRLPWEGYETFALVYMIMGMAEATANIYYNILGTKKFGTNYYSDGFAYLLREKYPKAAEYFLKAVELNRKFHPDRTLEECSFDRAFVEFSKGMECWRARDFEKATKNFDKAKGLFGDLVSWSKLANYLMEEVRAGKAIRSMKDLMLIWGGWLKEELQSAEIESLKEKDTNQEIAFSDISKSILSLTNMVSGIKETLTHYQKPEYLKDSKIVKKRSEAEKAEYAKKKEVLTDEGWISYEDSTKLNKKDFLIWIDETTAEIYIGKKDRKLTEAHKKMLIHLIEKFGNLVTYRELYEFSKVRELRAYIETDGDVIIGDNRGIVQRWISDLHKETGHALVSYIITVPGRKGGYKFKEKFKFCVIYPKISS